MTLFDDGTLSAKRSLAISVLVREFRDPLELFTLCKFTSALPFTGVNFEDTNVSILSVGRGMRHLSDDECVRDLDLFNLENSELGQCSVKEETFNEEIEPVLKIGVKGLFTI